MVKPFFFKLEKILDYRRQLEDQARMSLAVAQREHDEQSGLCEDIRGQLLAHDERVQKEQKFDAHTIWLNRLFEKRLEQDLTEARGELARLALKLQKCRSDVIERSKERKLLEKLKANQAKKHHEEEELKEQKEFDESATLRYKPSDI